LQGAAELADADAQAKGVKVVTAAEPRQVEADSTLLTAAVLNLLKNAVQASASPATIALRGQANPAGYVIEVEDEGPGIPEPVRQRIFEPFFSTREKGTGLGLPLARKIARAHGGELSVESHPGKTVFRLALTAHGSTAHH
jgi:signal transduction histidine kinase